MQKRIALRVIPESEPSVRTVFIADRGGDGTAFARGGRPVAYTCGGCDAPLLERVGTNRMVDIVFRCGACGAFNDT